MVYSQSVISWVICLLQQLFELYPITANCLFKQEFALKSYMLYCTNYKWYILYRPTLPVKNLGTNNLYF